MRRGQWIGLVLWRGGLLLAVAWGLYETVRAILRFIDVPSEVEIGLGLILAGLVLLMVSLVAERIRDRRAEGDLLR